MADSGGVGGEELTEEERIKKKLGLEDLDPRRVVLAKLEATRLIRTNPQKLLEHVPVFPIEVCPDEEDYDALLTDVQDWMRTVQSLSLYGNPVSSALVDVKEQKYYIIRLKKKGDARHVDHLFRATDMYYTGFKPSEEEKFFHFNDIVLPDWIPSLPLPENCAHDDIVDTTFGTHWWEEIYNTCLKCTSKNDQYRKYSNSRRKVLKWTILLFGEPPRLRSLKEKVKAVISTGVNDKVGSSEEGIHYWKSMSKIGFAYTIDPTCITYMKLLHDSTEYELFNTDRGKYEPWKIIGSEGEILVYKYDEILVQQIIKKQQDKSLRSICNLLEKEPSPSGKWKTIIHRSQRPNILIYLAYILCHGEGYSFRIRHGAGLLLERILREKFCTMVPAYQEYIKSQLVLCIWEADPLVRSSAAAVITQVLRMIHAEQWKELIVSLQTCLDSEVFEHIKGAMELIVKISVEVPGELEQISEEVPGKLEQRSEEVPGELENDVPDLAFIFLTRCLEMFKSPHADLRMLALECVNNYVLLRPSLLHMHIDHYLEVLICLYERNWEANEENGSKERLAAAMSIGSIAEECINRENSYLPKVMEVLILLVREEDHSVQTVACETLSHYSKYIVQSLRHPNGCKQFEEILLCLLEKRACSDSSVQSGASLALKSLEKEAATFLDVIDELNFGTNIYPLLRCLKSVAKAVQPGFCAFILPVFRVCTLLLEKGQKKETICTCLKVMSKVLAQGLSAGNDNPSVQGVSAGIQSLIQHCGLTGILDQLCSDEQDSDIQQSALNLVGKLSKVGCKEPGCSRGKPSQGASL